MLYQEHYSRRENLLFVGIEEQSQPPQDENRVENQQEIEKTEAVLFSFMEQELQIRKPTRQI